MDLVVKEPNQNPNTMQEPKPLSSKEKNEIHKWFNKIDELIAQKKQEQKTKTNTTKK